MQQQHIEQLESRIQYYVEQQSYLSLIKIDIQKYKSAYDKSLKEGTLYSPFTPDHQSNSFEIISLGSRDEIIELEEVLGDTKTWVDQVQEELKRSKAQIELLQRQNSDLESQTTRGDVQRERQLQDLLEYKKNTQHNEKSYLNQIEKLEKTKSEYLKKLDKSQADLKLANSKIIEERAKYEKVLKSEEILLIENNLLKSNLTDSQVKSNAEQVAKFEGS